MGSSRRVNAMIPASNDAPIPKKTMIMRQNIPYIMEGMPHNISNESLMKVANPRCVNSLWRYNAMHNPRR